VNTHRTERTTLRATGLESTLVKVYQNKRLQLPLESTLMKNRGRGGWLSLSFHRRLAPASHLFRTPSKPPASSFLILPLSPFPPISCALFNSLAAFFDSPVLCFQCFAHSLTKMRLSHPKCSYRTPGVCGIQPPASSFQMASNFQNRGSK
jgi:hypothetical protein